MPRYRQRRRCTSLNGSNAEGSLLALPPRGAEELLPAQTVRVHSSAPQQIALFAKVIILYRVLHGCFAVGAQCHPRRTPPEPLPARGQCSSRQTARGARRPLVATWPTRNATNRAGRRFVHALAAS